MGKQNSKEVTEDHSSTIQATEVDASSGLHIFEFHMPTAGLSYGSVILICVIIAIVIYLRRKCKCIRRHRRHHPRYDFYAGYQQQLLPIYRPTTRPLPIPAAERFQEIPAEQPSSAPEPAPRSAHQHRQDESSDHPGHSADYAWEPLPR